MPKPRHPPPARIAARARRCETARPRYPLSLRPLRRFRPRAHRSTDAHISRTTRVPNRPIPWSVPSARRRADSPAAADTRQAPLPPRDECQSTPSSTKEHLATYLFHYLKLAPLHKIVEKGRVRFQPAVLHPRHQLLEFPAPGQRQQGDARAFNRRVAHLYDPRVWEVGNQPDAARGVYLQVAAEPAGQIEYLDLVEADAVLAAHHLQARYVRALGLRQLVDVAFEKEDIVRPIHRDPRSSILEPSHRIHAPGTQQLAGQIHQAAPADTLRRRAADHAESESAVASYRHVFN